jgi:hypothetical protein
MNDLYQISIEISKMVLKIHVHARQSEVRITRHKKTKQNRKAEVCM